MDAAAVRHTFEFALDDLACHIVVAVNGEEGLAKLKASTYDRVILDLKMPGMNGVELLDEIRKIESRVPIQMIRAFAQEFLKELEQPVQEGRNFDLICKPLEREEIRAIASSALAIDLNESGAPPLHHRQRPHNSSSASMSPVKRRTRDKTLNISGRFLRNS
ncbi:MAG: response regulator [Nitrospirales bacterium]